MKKIFTQQIALFLCLSGFFCLGTPTLDAMPLYRSHTGEISAHQANLATNTPSFFINPAFTDPDSTAIFQQCLNLSGLQAFLEKNANGSYKQVNVLIHSIPFPADGSVTHNGTAIRQVTKSEVKTDNTIAYFYFHEFKIDGSSAYVDYVYNYDQSATSPKMQVIHLDLKKTGSDWSIINTKMEAR
jgi:hypothetical protein